MSTYIMTDIHGHYGTMKKMLDHIGFSAGDRLICAGDYIDRGTENVEMLEWIENPGGNVILVRGNHDEEFVYYVELMKRIFCQRKRGVDGHRNKNEYADMGEGEDIRTVYEAARKITPYFDCYGTIGELIRKRNVPFGKLLLWADSIRKMPYFYETVKDGRRCIIVHAGYIERMERLAGVETDGSYGSPEDFYLNARDDAYLYGGVEHGMIIAGHTPTTEKYELPFHHGRVYRFYDEEMDCIFYDLDCGCAFQDIRSEARLACLRLEDEKIFYIR